MGRSTGDAGSNHAPATNDSCVTPIPGTDVPFRRDRVLRVPATNDSCESKAPKTPASERTSGFFLFAANCRIAVRSPRNTIASSASSGTSVNKGSFSGRQAWERRVSPGPSQGSGLSGHRGLRDGRRRPLLQPSTRHGNPVRALTLGALRGVPALSCNPSLDSPRSHKFTSEHAITHDRLR